MEDLRIVLSQESVSDLASRYCSSIVELIPRQGYAPLEIESDDSPEEILRAIILSLIVSDIGPGVFPDDRMVQSYVSNLRDHGLRPAARFIEMAKAIESDEKARIQQEAPA